jgi:hypothetical protein
MKKVPLSRSKRINNRMVKVGGKIFKKYLRSTPSPQNQKAQMPQDSGIFQANADHMIHRH